MTVREGSLEAPTRHPLDWKSEDFYDETKLEKELERVFEICHGCRRCLSLCTAFPTLFDLVDESPTMEVDGVKKSDFAKVVEASKDNPVFYVQYAHARISSLRRKAVEAGLSLDGKADLSLLDSEELGLVKLAAQYPRVIEGAALAHEPHRVAAYLSRRAEETGRAGRQRPATATS